MVMPHPIICRGAVEWQLPAIRVLLETFKNAGRVVVWVLVYLLLVADAAL